MSVYGIPASNVLNWVNEIRIWAGVVAAVAAVAAGIAGYAQIRLQSVIAAEKDEALNLFKTESAERTAKALAEAARANEQTARLSAEAEAAGVEQERIREQNLTLSVSLERERAERLRLEGRLASRRLTPDQAQALVRSIRADSFVPMMQLTRLGDQEAHTYAIDIIRAFQSVGISVQINDIGIMAPPLYGIMVQARADDPIVRALQAAEMTPQVVETMSFVPMIIVGLKPPPL